MNQIFGAAPRINTVLLFAENFRSPGCLSLGQRKIKARLNFTFDVSSILSDLEENRRLSQVKNILNVVNQYP